MVVDVAMQIQCWLWGQHGQMAMTVAMAVQTKINKTAAAVLTAVAVTTAAVVAAMLVAAATTTVTVMTAVTKTTMAATRQWRRQWQWQQRLHIDCGGSVTAMMAVTTMKTTSVVGSGSDDRRKE